MIDSESRRAIERVSRDFAQGRSIGDLNPDDLSRVLSAAEKAIGLHPRRRAPRVSDTAGGTIARISTPHEHWLCWWSSYDQRWISETEGEIHLPDSALTIEEVDTGG